MYLVIRLNICQRSEVWCASLYLYLFSVNLSVSSLFPQVLGYYNRNNIDTRNLIKEIQSIASSPMEKFFFNVSEEAALSNIAGTLGNRIFNIEGEYYYLFLAFSHLCRFIFLLSSEKIPKTAVLCGRAHHRNILYIYVYTICMRRLVYLHYTIRFWSIVSFIFYLSGFHTRNYFLFMVPTVSFHFLVVC